MALYRNIGSMQPHQMGLILLPPATLPVASPSTTQTLQNYFGYTDPRTATIDYTSIQAPITDLITQTGVPLPTGGGTLTPQTDYTVPISDQIVQTGVPLPTGGPTREQIEANAQDIIDAANAVQQQFSVTYDMLLNMTPFDFTRNGYVIVGGSIFQSGKIVLALQDIQRIENERGTAGTLFMHLGEPVLAKDTAGYCCGNMRSQGAYTLYSTPIAEVLAIPDPPPPGGNVISDYNPPTPPNTTVTPIPPANNTTTTTPTTPATAAPGTVLPLLTVAGLALVAVAGVQLLKKKTGLVFAGGLGLLYFQLKKNTL